MQSLIQCINQDRIQSYLEKHDLTDIQPDRWYPVQQWLDVLSDISGSNDGAMFDFVSVGMKASEITPWPPDLEALPLEEALPVLNDAFVRSVHRGNVGYIKMDKVANNHLTLTFHTPYPDDLMYGSTYDHARRFLPFDTDFTVMYDETELRRDQGGDITIIHITWDD